jgi:uncharacterized protein (DUF697 family)
MTTSTNDKADALANELTHYKCLDAASAIISSSTKWSVVASLIPIPYLDLASLGVIQVNMIADLSKLYDQKVSKHAVRSVVAVLFGTLAPAGVAQYAVTSSAKFIPGYGSAISAVTLSTFGAAATYAIGKVFVRHFENGGSFENFSAAEVQADLKKEFSKAL